MSPSAEVSDRAAAAVREVRFRVGEMDCPSCLSKIEGRLAELEGVRGVGGSVLSRTLTVTVESGSVQDEQLRAEVARLGYTAEPLSEDEPRASHFVQTWATPQARRAYAALGVAVAGAIAGVATSDPLVLSSASYPLRVSGIAFGLAALIGGWNFFPKGLAAARRLSLDMNFLMTVAIVGAALLGELMEAAAIAVLFSIAELMEAYSVDRARASIASLMELAPDWAVVVRDGVESRVPASSLLEGDEIVVRPGDRIAADGTVLEGASAVDQSPITGESLPVEKVQGDGVFSGTINREGHLRVRIDRRSGESALAKIVRLVEEAEGSKTESERFVERFARYYTPVITTAAVIVATAPPLLFDGSPTVWITRGLTLLVIACPCALVISTPVAVVSGLTAAARHGVLIKGGSYLEAMATVPVIALDKTGTLTVGHPVVRSITTISGDETDTIARAAAIERRSQHPLARAIVEEADRRRLPDTRFSVTRFEAIPGKGARARLDGEEHVIGRPDLFPGVEAPKGLEERGESVIGLAREGELVAWIALADEPRDAAAAAMTRLRDLGIERTIMLTGDNRATANAVASVVGVDEVRAELLPAEKLKLLVELKGEYGAVAMVGDGVNDAPALASATVGIAMGAVGSDTALETADVALMGDDLERLPYLIRLSRRSRRVIQQNIAAAIAIKAVLAIGVPLGFVSLITAVLIGDLGVSLAVTVNALRLGRVSG